MIRLVLGRVLAVLGLLVVTFAIVPTALIPEAGAAPSDPLSVADVVTSSPFSGTISQSSGSNPCGYEPLTFDGSYPGSSAVGTVDLSVVGCFNFYTDYYSGSFTITTSVGTLSGSASGPESVISIGIPPTTGFDQYSLDLTVTAGTGSFAATTGSVEAVFDASLPGQTTFEGTVTDTFTQVLLPQGGIVNGTTYLDAVAYAASGASITKVVFEVSGGGLTSPLLIAAAPTLYGWLAQWNTTLLASNIYDLVSVATDSNGNTLTSSAETFQVDNPPPSTAILIPSGGATLSGTSAVLDATASSPDGAPIASVTFSAGNAFNGDFGSLGTATPTLYGYIFVWNTTAVPNGTYTLQSLVTDVAGNSSNSTASVTVDNPTPTTAVLIPPAGASVSGTSSLLDASASANVTYVAFELSGGTINGEQLIATATPTYYGWLAEWDTTGVPDGTYQLQSVASYSRYFSGGTSAPITITVAN